MCGVLLVVIGLVVPVIRFPILVRQRGDNSQAKRKRKKKKEEERGTGKNRHEGVCLGKL